MQVKTNKAIACGESGDHVVNREILILSWGFASMYCMYVFVSQLYILFCMCVFVSPFVYTVLCALTEIICSRRFYLDPYSPPTPRPGTPSQSCLVYTLPSGICLWNNIVLTLCVCYLWLRTINNINVAFIQCYFINIPCWG